MLTVTVTQSSKVAFTEALEIKSDSTGDINDTHTKPRETISVYQARPKMSTLSTVEY